MNVTRCAAAERDIETRIRIAEHTAGGLLVHLRSATEDGRAVVQTKIAARR